MGEFFWGWRRKIGLLSLVMALWVRSNIFFDAVAFRYGQLLQSNNSFVSAYRGLEWISFWGGGPPHPKEKTIWTSGRIDANFVAKRFRVSDREQGFELCGFVFEQGQSFGGLIQMRTIVVPYWAIAVPLTLISAFLLLSKSHRSTQMKLTEPVPVEGT